MADEVQLDLIQQDVETWNAWRKKSPATRA
jgi:hypothetical protein